MSYDRQSLLNSEAAYNILRCFYQSEKEEGLYSKQVAEKTGNSKNTVSKYIKSLRDFDLIERSKRNKAQYYRFNLNGLIKLLNDYWEEKFQEAIDSENYLMDPEDQISQMVETEEYYPDKLEKFDYNTLESYFIPYLDRYEDSTIKQMIYDDFQADLESVMLMLDDSNEERQDEDSMFSTTRIGYYVNTYRMLEFRTGNFLRFGLNESDDGQNNDG